MDAKLTTILQHKNKGDQWYSFLAPEDCHYWDFKYPWNLKQFRAYEVELFSVTVGSNETVPNTKNRITYSLRHPLYLNKTGIEIASGFSETKTKRSGRYKIHCDSIIELNDALKELSEITEIHFWEVKKIRISNKSAEGISLFQRHNPDGHGVNLYFYKQTIGKQEWLYPDISFSDQEYYVGKFKQYFAACTCDERLQKFHGCTVKKESRKPIPK